PRPGQRMRFEGAGEEVEQADPELLARGGGNVAVSLGRKRGGRKDGERGAAGRGRFRKGDGNSTSRPPGSCFPQLLGQQAYVGKLDATLGFEGARSAGRLLTRRIV